MKNLLRTADNFNQVFTDSPFFRKVYSISCQDLSRQSWFDNLPKEFLIKDVFSCQFAKCRFLFFFKSDSQQVLSFVYKVLFCLVLFLRNLLRSLYLLLLLQRSFLTNGVLLPRPCFLLHGICLFKILILISRNVGKPSTLLTKTSFESSCNGDYL